MKTKLNLVTLAILVPLGAVSVTPIPFVDFFKAINQRDLAIGAVTLTVGGITGMLINNKYTANALALEKLKNEKEEQKKIELHKKEEEEKTARLEQEKKEALSLLDQVKNHYKRQFSLLAAQRLDHDKPAFINSIRSMYNTRPLLAFYQSLETDIARLKSTQNLNPEKETVRAELAEKLEQIKASYNLMLAEHQEIEQQKNDQLKRLAEEHQRKKQKEDLELEKLLNEERFKKNKQEIELEKLRIEQRHAREKAQLEIEKLNAEIAYYKSCKQDITKELEAIKQELRNRDKIHPTWATEFTRLIKDEIITLKKRMETLENSIVGTISGFKKDFADVKKDVRDFKQILEKNQPQSYILPPFNPAAQQPYNPPVPAHQPPPSFGYGEQETNPDIVPIPVPRS
jgi:hypothetical protein